MYYTPVATRRNLTVLVSAHVWKIQTHPNANSDGTVSASGVVFYHQKRQYEVYSSKEVVLCAGYLIFLRVCHTLS